MKDKILIVEDNNLVVKILTFLLQQEGYESIVAIDGNEGIAALEAQRPDLILTDIILPYKSGLEVIAFAMEKYPEVPIIVVSSLGLIDDTIKAALNLGAREIVSKPFVPNQLLKTIKSFLAEQVHATETS